MTQPRVPDSVLVRRVADPIGVAASGLCAVHCVLCAALPGIVGVLGLEVLSGHRIEWGFTIVAIAFASVSLWHGWRRHRSLSIAAALLLGMTGLLASRTLESVRPDDAAGDADHHAAAVHDPERTAHEHHPHMLGAWLGIVGGVVLIGGHLLTIHASWRSHRCCDETATM